MQASHYRFSVGHLFYVIFLAAASSAMFGQFGLAVAAFVLIVWLQLLAGVRREVSSAIGKDILLPEDRNKEAAGVGDPWSSDSYQRTGGAKLEWLVVAMIIAMLIGLLIPATNDADPMRHAEMSMKIVVRALEAYEQRYGEFPPTIIYDERGVPLHSWRALILRQLGEDRLAATYRLNEPWNSPHNSQLAGSLPWHYQAYYPKPAPRPGATALHLLPDASGLVTLVEHEATLCNWLEPVDECRWSDFHIVPPIEDGFWHHRFFLSSYRGRLAVSSQGVRQIHPAPLLPDWPDVESGGCVQPVDCPKPYRELHYDNLFRLVVFLIAAFYPFRWLNALRYH